ncbi:MAG: hypothetical protein HFH86_03500 [Bacilli bacterium]|nr:hypothetical protein [Bacilli bacterium]
MSEHIFINQAFTSAINLYLTNKQTPENPLFSSFPVMVIRTLINIYGELDIINPYRTNNENRMGGFDSNLTKFGFSKSKLQDFKITFQNCHDATQPLNLCIIKIEKYLIDMFFLRKKTVAITEEQIIEFKKYLYLSVNNNSIIQEQIRKYNVNNKIIDLYFESKLYESNHDYKFIVYKRNTLIPEAYSILGYNLDIISQMDEQTLNQLNDQILAFFKIDLRETNKMERLKEAIAYYKRYNHSFTSGNGYVDMLLLLSLIATVMMTLFAVTVKVLG